MLRHSARCVTAGSTRMPARAGTRIAPQRYQLSNTGITAKVTTRNALKGTAYLVGASVRLYPSVVGKAPFFPDADIATEQKRLHSPSLQQEPQHSDYWVA
jgi:hypothetical protein